MYKALEQWKILVSNQRTITAFFRPASFAICRNINEFKLAYEMQVNDHH